MRTSMCAWLIVVVGVVGSQGQTLRVEREKVLYADMQVVPIGPFVSSPRAASGVVWSQTIVHATGVPAVRVHVRVRQGRPAGDWRIRFRDLSGREIESFGGNSPQLATGGVWSSEIPGRGAEIELVADASAAGLEIEVDRYAYRVISAIPMSISGIDQRIPIGKAPQEVRGWAGPIARLSFISEQRQYVCTGFLMTRDLLVTNEHCLGTPEIAASALADFGFDSLDAKPTTVRVLKLEAADVALDYAVVRLAAAPAGFGRVTVSQGPAAEDQPLVVVQHPAGEYKQASIDDCRVRGASRPGVTTATTDFGHLCDTLGGSSGSPVLDRNTGGLVGLHHFGFVEGTPNPVNQGVHFALVLDDLRRRFPALHAELTAQ